MLPRAGWTKAPWSIVISEQAARPGDFVFPHERHVTMLLAHDFVIHAPRTGDVIHIQAMYTNPLAFRRVDPSKA